jgi:hypothetical protein
MSEAPETANRSTDKDDPVHCQSHDLVQVRTIVHPRQRNRLFAEAKRAAKQARKIMATVAKRINGDAEGDDVSREVQDLDKDGAQKTGDEDEDESGSDDGSQSDSASDDSDDSESSSGSETNSSSETESMTASVISVADDVQAVCCKCSQLVKFPLLFCITCKGTHCFHHYIIQA